jgi:hypothetical protein
MISGYVCFSKNPLFHLEPKINLRMTRTKGASAISIQPRYSQKVNLFQTTDVYFHSSLLQTVIPSDDQDDHDLNHQQ